MKNRLVFLLLGLLFALPVFAGDKDSKFDKQFYVSYSTMDAGGCYMLLKSDGTQYSVWSGQLFPHCVVLLPKQTIAGRFRYGRSTIQLEWSEGSKLVSRNYQVREIVF